MTAITKVRLRVAPHLDQQEALTALSKAVVGLARINVLTDVDRKAARRAAGRLRAEFTGVMTRTFPQYEEHFQLLNAEIKRRRGRPRQELLQQRKHLRDRTEWLLRTQFKRYYTNQFIHGKRVAGSAKALAKNEEEIIRRLANNEAEFALNVLVDAEEGEYTRPLDWRGKLYGNALDEAKWLGYLYADLSAQRYVRWVMTEAEHCIDCCFMAGRLDIIESEISQRINARETHEPTEREAALLNIIDANRQAQGGRWGNGVYRVQELVRMGIVPQSGRLTCTTNCKCRLQPAWRPKGTTKQKEQRRRLESLTGRMPTMLLRKRRGEARGRLARLAETWKHKHLPRRAGRR